jgi:hypothetical protein
MPLLSILFYWELIYLTETECSNLTPITLQVLAYTGNEDAKKFFLSGEISLDNIKVIAEICLEIRYQRRSEIFRVWSTAAREYLLCYYFFSWRTCFLLNVTTPYLIYDFLFTIVYFSHT